MFFFHRTPVQIEPVARVMTCMCHERVHFDLLVEVGL